MDVASKLCIWFSQSFLVVKVKHLNSWLKQLTDAIPSSNRKAPQSKDVTENRTKLAKTGLGSQVLSLFQLRRDSPASK